MAMVGRMWKRVPLVGALPLVALGALVSGGLAGADPAADGPAVVSAITPIAWTQEKTPMPTTGRTGNRFDGVWCTAANACEAVGSYSTSTVPGLALAAVWNGTAWKLQPVPKLSGATATELLGVSCISTTACEAVGDYLTASAILPFAAVWNGSVWADQKTPVPTSSTSASLAGVWCAAASGLCEAVGHSGTGSMAEKWNGTSWKLQTTPTLSLTNGLNGVSCSASNACEAVGSTYNPGTNANGVLAERWNGTSWAQQSIPSPSSGSSSLISVSCVSIGKCETVGNVATPPGHAVAEKWNGTSWALQSMPGSTGSVTFGWVSCSTAAACDAIGYFTTAGATTTLVEAWNGTAWATESAPSPFLGEASGISCPSTGACQAVGVYTTSSGIEPLALAGR